MSEACIVYTPRADAMPEGEVAALASVYRFILFESSARKEATRPGGHDDAEDLEDDRTDTKIIRE